VTSPVRLHLGCGDKYITGFVHVDVLPYDHVDHIAKVDSLDFVDDQSVDLIYASHLLEHFGRHEYLGVLAEWFRVLRVGGVLRLGVPDFRAISEEYLASNTLGDILGLCMGGQRDEWDFHKMIFDEQTLEHDLRAVGFTSIRRWDWRETEHRDIDDYTQAYLPHMDKSAGRLMSLNVEAIR
jgi:predicted SAM-dependent methyltransferase